MKTAETAFYELLTGNLVVMVPDQQVRDQGVRPENMVNADYRVNENDNYNYSDVNVQADAYEAQAEPEADPFEEGQVAENIANDTMKAAEDALKELREAADANASKPFRGDEIDDFGGPKDEHDDL